VIADAAVPAVALCVPRPVFCCGRVDKLFGFPRFFDEQSIFGNHHDPTPSDEG
jgi:hypothetical protein